MNTALDHANAAWRAGGGPAAIEASINAYVEELIGRLDQEKRRGDTLEALLVSTREYADDLLERKGITDTLLLQGSTRIEELQEEVRRLNATIRQMKCRFTNPE